MYPKPKRIENKKLMTSYHTEQTCLLCSNPATPAHIKGRGAFGDDVSENMAPLCGIHHTEQGQIGMTTFADKYQIFKKWLLDSGWEFNSFLNKWRHAGKGN